jgi:hypothetical protein
LLQHVKDGTRIPNPSCDSKTEAHFLNEYPEVSEFVSWEMDLKGTCVNHVVKGNQDAYFLQYSNGSPQGPFRKTCKRWTNEKKIIRVMQLACHSMLVQHPGNKVGHCIEELWS